MLPEGVLQSLNKRKLLASVWDFGAVHPKSERKHYLCNDHPAKMKPSLARAILQIYGESPVLDLMCGIGTTCVEATLLGMDSVGIEYEKKFVAHARKNIQHLRKLYPDKTLGKAKIIQGDARHLTKIFRQNAGSIVFSPPYHTATSGEGAKGRNLKRPSQRWIQERTGMKADKIYSDNRENIGNVANYGTFNSIIFSPPYGEANRGGGIAKRGYVGIHGIDKRLNDRCDRPVSEDRNNISNLLYGQSYLGEMFRVYSECYKVLKPRKFMVVVVKDIRRKGLTIPIAADTIKLCQLAGFELFDIIINRLYFPSFWQIQRAIKDQEEGIPHPLRIHEYILIFRKIG